MKSQLLWDEKFRLKPCNNKLFRSHSVVFNKAENCKGRSAQNADPGRGFCADNGLEQKIKPNGDHTGTDRKNELSKRQSKKRQIPYNSGFPY